ncbi:MAG TPA: hypothetical protein VFA13_00690 [Candidatus Acidoferrum sp.]|nr:hypothetical protein [Candidatus Acidoferrum sp.]
MIKYVMGLFASALAFAQYGGPGILAGSMGNIGERGGRPSGIRFFAGVNGTMDAGLLPVGVDQQGHLIEEKNLYGVTANVGAYGHKDFRHTAIGLNFTANYRHYSQNQYYDGVDTALALTVERQVSRRLVIGFNNIGGTMSQGFGALYGYVNTPGELVGVPVNNIFDNRTYFWQTAGQVTYQQSARLAYTAGGSGFFIRPQSKLLIGVNGYGGTAGVTYQFTRRTSGFFSYNFYHFDYPRAFGESNANVALIGINRALSRRWTLQVGAGASRTSTIGVAQTAADPVTAALFGITSVTEAFSVHTIYPAFQAGLIGKFHRSSLTINYIEMPNPGNGVYLTSNMRSASAVYSYVANRRTSTSAGISYSDMESIGQKSLGRYRYFYGSVGATYRIAQSLHATLTAGARNMYINNQGGFSRVGYFVAIGLMFSPGERPLAFW